MRKLLLALATCGIVAMGASQPADARIFLGFGFGHGGYNNHWRSRCYFKNVRVKVWSSNLHRFVWRWQTRRICW